MSGHVKTSQGLQKHCKACANTCTMISFSYALLKNASCFINFDVRLFCY